MSKQMWNQLKTAYWPEMTQGKGTNWKEEEY